MFHSFCPTNQWVGVYIIRRHQFQSRLEVLFIVSHFKQFLFCYFFQMSSYSCISEYGSLQWNAESKWRTNVAFFFFCVIFNLSSADSSPFSYTKRCMAEVREQHGSRCKQQRMSKERASHSSSAICSCSLPIFLLYAIAGRRQGRAVPHQLRFTVQHFSVN